MTTAFSRRRSFSWRSARCWAAESGGDRVPLGPVQLLVVGFDRPDFSGELLGELERLRESDVVRVIDLLVVHKGADGVVRRLHHPDLIAAEDEGAGAVISALVGFGEPPADAEGGQLPVEEEYWSLDEAIPDDSA